jgi:tryptophan 2,3-dioxygenase
MESELREKQFKHVELILGRTAGAIEHFQNERENTVTNLKMSLANLDRFIQEMCAAANDILHATTEEQIQQLVEEVWDIQY